MKRNIYNIDKCNDKTICAKYKCKIDNILKENQDNNETINETWEKLKEIVSYTSVEVFNSIKSSVKPWLYKNIKMQLREGKWQGKNGWRNKL